MTTDAWIQILIAVSIVAVIVLIAALYRLFEVLGDVKVTTKIAAERAKEIDATIDQAEEKIGSIAEVVRGFMHSLDVIKIIKDKFKNKKGKNDDKS